MTGEIRHAGVTGGLRFDGYDWRGGREAMLRLGPDEGPVVIAAPPLFEEANRTRAFTVAILRALAARGIGSVLPDVPGQGESLTPLEAVSLADMQDAFAAAASTESAKRRSYVVAVRSGVLLDSHASVSGRWHFAPQQGNELVRELSRVQQLNAALRPEDRGRWYEYEEPVEIGGNIIAATFLQDLGKNPPRILDRTLRLSSDPPSADRKFDGPALWRRSEPGNDPALAQTLAEDIADWIARCEG